MEVQLPLWVMIVTALSGTLGGIGGVIAIVRQCKRDKWEGQHAGKRTDADVSSTLTQSAISLINELQEQVSKLHDRVKYLEDERERLEYRITCLESENRGLGVDITLLKEVVVKRDRRISELEAENKVLHNEVARLEARVRELENKEECKHGECSNA